MKSVLIVITSANKRTSFLDKTYNEQEVGLAKALMKQGYKCGIAYYGGANKREENVNLGSGTVKMYLLNGRDFLKTAVFDDYSDICKQYDIIMPISYDHYETYHLAMKYPEKTVIYHGTYYSEFNKRYNFKCKVFDKFILKGYRKNNTMFVTKNKLAAAFLNEKGLYNTHIIGVGFDAEQMMASEMIDSELSKVLAEAKKDNYNILLYIGKIEPRRNTLFLLDVFNDIRKKCKAKLVIIGNGSNEYKERCKSFAQKNNLNDSIIYREKIEQKLLSKVYSLSNLFLLPTSYEIFGMVILEAMYFEVPVLTTLNGGSDILIEDGKTGFIIPQLEKELWTEKCIDILTNDMTELRRYARNKIKKEFTWDALAEKFVAAFEEKLLNK